MLLYYITDRSQFPGNETERRQKLLAHIAEAWRCGVDYVQLRERDLSSRELEALASQVQELRTENREQGAGFLINSRTDVALAAGADGVHLRAGDISPADVRFVFSRLRNARGVVAASCHTLQEVRAAADGGADFTVFGPVFGKAEAEAVGLEKLHEASQVGIPVLALGGVTVQNAASCLGAGAAGVAGIRLFQSGSITEAVRKLRLVRT